MFGVAKDEMSTTSEENASSAKRDSVTPPDSSSSVEGVTDVPASPQASGQEHSAHADAGRAGTESTSGIWSAPTRGSVLAGGTPGPTSSALTQLASDVGGDSSIVERFVVDYLSLLDDRVYRLTGLLHGTDDDATLIAILSLETTSSMIGANEIVRVAPTLRAAVGSTDSSCRETALEQLQDAVAGVRNSLANLGFSAVRQPRPAAE